MGDAALSSFRYLFAGYRAVPEGKEYELEQYFDYHEHFFLKSTGAVFSLPFSLVIGSALKGASYLFPETRAHHRAIIGAFKSQHVQFNDEYYRTLGIDIGENFTEKSSCMGYKRGPIDENHLNQAKEAFFQIVSLFKQNRIIFWVDCGTCLGAYRYGGLIPWDNDIDIAVLEPDFANIKRVLNALDPSHYLVEDWSNRSCPKTYIRVYIRSTREYIDIYHFAIFPEKKAVQYILSSEDSAFLTQAWKIRERRFKIQTPFEIIFPLKRADFEGVEVPVPYKTEKYLQMRYGENLAPAKIYNVETQEYEKDLSHPYWQLVNAH
jgi:hypothetical protein